MDGCTDNLAQQHLVFQRYLCYIDIENWPVFLCWVYAVIRVTRNITINEREIKEHFIRASGPGGQNVNKVSTAVQLRFDVLNSPSLPHEVRSRLIRLAGKRISQNGTLIINARRFRTQERNRQDAIQRLIRLVQKASERPRVRRKTKASPASKAARLEDKRRQGRLKRMRRSAGQFGDQT